ncbi:hypothetical protein BD410DRAFT_808190 [Rickenella mellea]|uniref:Protein kinase domain-containing protein n=1 Tax=Rickenella mellea TaxID=50990 RepID=A0A4Y7PML4_9AGAM|nr:hypothetical protein BD410DRAFT_808190 [Rickenella mellea]
MQRCVTAPGNPVLAMRGCDTLVDQDVIPPPPDGRLMTFTARRLKQEFSHRLVCTTSKLPLISMAAHDDSEKRSTVNDLLLNASSALELASQLAPLLPVPFVPSIFASAKLIVDAANNVRQNKTDCANLAKRVAELTLDVSRQIHGREELAGDHLKAALEQLQVQFLEIQHFMEQQVSLNLLKHFIRRGSITASVNELRLKLDFTMRTFQTTSSIRMELQMSNFQRHMMKEKEWDGQYRIYRLGDLYLQRSLYKDQNAEYFQAEVRHRAAVVKLLRNLQNRAAFLENTTALKHLKHPNVAQLDGLSDGDMDEFYFIALKGALIPAMDYMKAVPVDRRCIEYLHLDAELFLDDRSLQSSGDIFKLMVDFESRQPVIGAIEDFWPSYRYAEEQSWTTSFDKLMASCLRNRACRNYSIVPISPPPAAKYIYCDFPFEVRQLCSTPRTRLSAMKKAIDGFLFVMTDMLSSGMTPIEEILALFINCDVLRVFGKNVLGYLFYQTPSSAPLGSIGYLKFTQGGRPEFVVLDVMPEFKVTSKHQSCGKCGVGLSIDVADICWCGYAVH